MDFIFFMDSNMRMCDLMIWPEVSYCVALTMVCLNEFSKEGTFGIKWLMIKRFLQNV